MPPNLLDAVELAEEIVAVAQLVEEDARDTSSLNKGVVEQAVRSIRRLGSRLVEQLGQGR